MKRKLIGISGKMGSGKDFVGKIIQYLTAPEWETEVVDFESWEDSGESINSPFEIKKFADKLKEIVCILLGCTRDQLECRDFKNKELGEEWWYYKGETKLFPYNTPHEANKKLPLIKLNPRKLLQLLGTECGREIIHPSIWVNSLFADYNQIPTNSHTGGMQVNHFDYQFPSWIITDLRFPNEAKAIKGKGGVLIRVNRPSEEVFVSEGEKPKGNVTVIRKLDNGEEIEWDCFWDDGWWESGSGIKIPNVVKWLSKSNEHHSERALDGYQEFDYIIDNSGSKEDLIKKVKQILENENII